MAGPNARNNLVAGNFIGTDPAASYGSPTFVGSGDAILIDSGARDNRIGEETLAGRNVLSGNQRSAVHVYSENTRNNIIRNNIVGLSPDGTRRLTNRTHGVDIDQGATLNIVGGTGALQRNVLSGNSVDGVEVPHLTTTIGNQIVGNYIGTDLTGNAGPAYARNSDHGVHVDDGSTGTIITDNVVGNNGPGGGIQVEGNLTTLTAIARNRVGISLDGTAIPNAGPGISVIFHATRTTIGPGNVVANHVDGIVIGPEADVDRNTITRNSIYGNSGLGIDVLPAGVNPNGFYPANGPNQAAQFPVIGSATTSVVTGRACASCTVEIFAADGGTNAFGEGITFAGSAAATAAGTFSVPVAVTLGDFVTATATDANGNTSEFSLNRAVTTSGDSAPGTVLARDQYSRTVTDAWGSATVGGPWSVVSPYADYDVGAGTGTIVVPAAGVTRTATLSSFAQRDVDTTIRLATDKVATGGNHWVYVVARQGGNARVPGPRAHGGQRCRLRAVQPRRRERRDRGRPRDARERSHPYGRRWHLGPHAGDGSLADDAARQGLGRRRPRAERLGIDADELRSCTADRRRSRRAHVRRRRPCPNAPITVSFDELRVAVPAADDGLAPAAPQGLAATTGSNRVALAWTPNGESDVIGYHVYRSTTPSVPTTGTPLTRLGPRDGRRPTSTPPPSTTRPTTTSSSPPTRPHGARRPRTRPAPRPTRPRAAACSSTARAST